MNKIVVDFTFYSKFIVKSTSNAPMSKDLDNGIVDIKTWASN